MSVVGDERRSGWRLSADRAWRSLVVWCVVWFVGGVIGRGVLATRIEGIFDHDQAVVSLMALDIAEGRRWPIFFDGQRYMGAVEAYVAAALVRVFGFSPRTVTLAPLLFCGLFVALQFWVWNRWRDRATGHMAAFVTLLCAPMAAVWTMVARGGYVEVLCWALAALYVYRVSATWHERGAVAGWKRFGWGFLLGVGFFINPLSVVVYVTLALDWTFGWHGAWLRRERGLTGGLWSRVLDSRWSLVCWLLGAVLAYLVLATGCHVRLEEGAEFRFVWGLLPRGWGLALGGVTIGVVLLGLAWWTGAAERAARLLVSHRAFALGLAVSLIPFVVFQARSRLGWEAPHASLPMWLRDPMAIGTNARDLGRALPALVGCDARGVALMYERWPESYPADRNAAFSTWLARLAPLVVALVFGLVARVIWKDRWAWRTWLALRGEGPARGTMLCVLGLVSAAGLYLVQSTSPDGSSTRYLVPMWVFLPGLVAVGARVLGRVGWVVAGVLLAGWGLAQACVYRDLDRPHGLRPLAAALDGRGDAVILAPQHVGLVVAALTEGRVGVLEYQPYWGRIHERYAGRVPRGGVLVCVAERVNRGLPQEDLARRMRELAASHPGTTRLVDLVGAYEIWETVLPRSLVCAEGRLAQAATGG